ncbi:hypothetical protein [Staphylococcus nepalensis]|uniref:hypothetical protein n=1 Tax=Staphylococcus nepalensis TaxID=214473 RepID=UPI0024BBC76F|nr:hypothetical protein [Staphylococcus nepalensis]
MISYSFNNNTNINKSHLLDIFKNNYSLDIIDNTPESTILGNIDMMVDIDKKFINILLYKEDINIKLIKKYLLENYNE